MASGEFDETTRDIIKEKISPLIGDGNEKPLKDGMLGGPVEDFHYDISGVVYWNAYVTYGSLSAAAEAGMRAIQAIAPMCGEYVSFVAGVAQQESGFIPTSESSKFCTDAEKISWVDSKVFPDESTDAEVAAITIVYKGIRKAVRRAQGLMQLAPGVGFGRARAKVGNDINRIVALVRSPLSNVALGAELLGEHKHTIVSNEENFNRLMTIVEENKAFEAMYKECNIKGIDLALSGCAAYMYNKGPNNGNTENIIEQMANLKYDPLTKEAYYNEDKDKRNEKTKEHGYSHRVITYMVQNAPILDNTK